MSYIIKFCGDISVHSQTSHFQVPLPRFFIRDNTKPAQDMAGNWKLESITSILPFPQNVFLSLNSIFFFQNGINKKYNSQSVNNKIP